MGERLVCLLVPAQHSPGENAAKQERREQCEPHQPIELSGCLVRGRDQHACHVQARGEDHQVGSPEVDATYHVAKRSHVLDVLDACPGTRGIRVVVLRQPCAADGEADNADEGGTAEGVPDGVGVSGDGITQGGKSEPVVEPRPEPGWRCGLVIAGVDPCRVRRIGSRDVKGNCHVGPRT